MEHKGVEINKGGFEGDVLGIIHITGESLPKGGYVVVDLGIYNQSIDEITKNPEFQERFNDYLKTHSKQ